MRGYTSGGSSGEDGRANRLLSFVRSPTAALATEQGRGGALASRGARSFASSSDDASGSSGSGKGSGGKGKEGKGESKASDSKASEGGEGIEPPAASSSGGASASSTGGIMVGGGHPSSHPQVLALPLLRRPLMPGVVQIVKIRDQRLLAELEEMRNRGQAYVGAFVKKAEGDHAYNKASQSFDKVSQSLDKVSRSFDKATHAAAAAVADGEELEEEESSNGNWDPADDMHDIGTFAQVQQMIYERDLAGGSSMSSSAGSSSDADKDGGDASASGDVDDKGLCTVFLLGHRRLRKTHTVRSDPMVVRVEHLKDLPLPTAEENEGRDLQILKATGMEVIATIKDLLHVNPLSREALKSYAQKFNDFQDPARLADLGASMCTSDDYALQEILEHLDIRDRLGATLVLLKKEVELGKLQTEIGRRVEEKISADQRKYFLMEQLKSIKKELGMERDDKTALALRFTEKFAPFKDQAPAETVRVVEEELQKLSGLEPSSSEFNVTRNYLEWLTSIPWGHSSDERLDIEEAAKVLDADHYGLEDVKERILEFVAVGQLRGTTQGKIITMVGPPGTGKTSIGQSIARALDRKFFRFSVGGLSDVAEIKGHRRTYVGAMPGKLVQCLKSTGVSNPVVLIDEIDKLGRGYQGDPASALLELLDPEQNGTFLDHYLDVPVDLSKVLFVCTANVLDTIPGPLLDRMEVVRLSGYIAAEKVAIARTYLEKTTKERCGIGEGEAAITDQAMTALIEDYCREAGVRNLQKHLEKIYRKVALKLAKAKGPVATKAIGDARAKALAAGKAAAAKEAELKKLEVDNKESLIYEVTELEAKEAKEAQGMAELEAAGVALANSVVLITVDKADLVDYVGQPPFQTDRIYDLTPPGVVTGLAWTSMGGSTLYIECTAIVQGRGGGGGDGDEEEDGKDSKRGGGGGGGGLKTTGQLGDVMKESTAIAHTYARSFLARNFPGNAFFDETNLHIHVPAGATPKDGPSAGCTMITAMVSLATGKPVKPNLAMTGEVTLTGIVMPIGGVKEKTIAARRSGVTTILFPAGNKKDYEELSADIREGLEVHFVKTFDEVYQHALTWDASAFDTPPVTAVA